MLLWISGIKKPQLLGLPIENDVQDQKLIITVKRSSLINYELQNISSIVYCVIIPFLSPTHEVV